MLLVEEQDISVEYLESYACFSERGGRHQNGGKRKFSHQQNDNRDMLHTHTQTLFVECAKKGHIVRQCNKKKRNKFGANNKINNNKDPRAVVLVSSLALSTH